MNNNLPNTYSFLIERTARVMKQYSAQILRETGEGITIEQWALLKKLDEHGPMSQVELAEGTFKDKPTVTRILDLIEKKGWVQRMPDPGDRRKFIIQQTKEGKAVVKRVLPIVQDIRAKGWEGLSERDLSSLKRILSKVESNFTD